MIEVRGAVLLGPFEAKGWVSARPKGHGQWACKVASNQMYDASFTTESGPNLQVHSQELWNGIGRGEPGNTPIKNGLAHDSLRRLKPQAARDLSFKEEVSAGTIHRGHETFENEGTSATSHDKYSYWRNLETHASLTAVTTPGFEKIIGRWAYVWGLPSGIERAISLTNGEEVSVPISSKGAYLVKYQDPDDFEVEDGTYAANGTPIPKTRRSLPPGKHAKAERVESPGEVFVRAQGTGLLRGIELIEEIPMGPEGTETTRTRDIVIPDGPGERRPEQVVSQGYR